MTDYDKWRADGKSKMPFSFALDGEKIACSPAGRFRGLAGGGLKEKKSIIRFAHYSSLFFLLLL